ncbi:MAG: hypothetical protein RQ842_04360 [Vulcanisaeta sp.]|nr:hypothetical protein [Vulcanisaeta sp.]
MTTTKSNKNRRQKFLSLSAREGDLVACVSKSVGGGDVLYVNIAPKGDREHTIAVVLNVDAWSKDKSVTVTYGADLRSVVVNDVNTESGFSRLISTINRILSKLGVKGSVSSNGPIADLLHRVFQNPRQWYDAASYTCSPKSAGKGGGGSNVGSGGGGTGAPAAPSLNLHRVTCKPCGGCCGGVRTKSFRGDWFEVLNYVAQAIGARSLCEVVNRYPNVFCTEGTASTRRHGLNALKELERLVSREHVYKASYVIKRQLECGSNPICWRYVEMAIEGWYRLVFFLAGRVPGDVHQYANRLAASLGFKSMVDWGTYIREVVQGLVDPILTDKHGGYKDVLKVQCRLCGETLETTDSVVAFLVKLTRHMKSHDINTIEDVRRRIEELRKRLEGRRGEVGKKLPAQVEQLEKLDLLGYLVRLSKEIGLIDALEGGGYTCNACGRDFGSEAELVDHIIHGHADLNRVVPMVDRFASEIRKFGVRSGIIERVGDGYRCALCGVNLRSPADVTEHILTHLGDVAWLVRRVREEGKTREEGGSPPGKGGKVKVQAAAPVPVVAPTPAAQPVVAELVDPHVMVYGDVDDKPLYGCDYGFQCYPYFYFEWAVEEYGLPGPLVGKRTRFIPLPRNKYIITNGDVLNVQMLSGADLGTVNTVVRWFLQSFILDPMYRCTLPDMGGAVSGELVRERGNRLTMTLYTRDIAELVINHGILGGGGGDGVDVRAVEGIVDAMFRVFSEALKPPIIARYHRGGDEAYLVLKLPNPCPPTETTLVARVGGKTKAGSIYMFY